MGLLHLPIEAMALLLFLPTQILAIVLDLTSKTFDLLLFLPLQALALWLHLTSQALRLFLFIPSQVLAMVLYLPCQALAIILYIPLRALKLLCHLTSRALGLLLSLPSRALALILSPLHMTYTLVTVTLEEKVRKPFVALPRDLYFTTLQTVGEELISSSWEISWPLVIYMGDAVAEARWLRVVSVVGQVFEYGRASHPFLPLEYISDMEVTNSKLQLAFGESLSPLTLEEMEGEDTVCEPCIQAKIEWWETRMEATEEEEEVKIKQEFLQLSASYLRQRDVSLSEAETILSGALAPENTSGSDTASWMPESQPLKPGRRRQSVQLGHIMQPEIHHLLKKSHEHMEDTSVHHSEVDIWQHSLSNPIITTVLSGALEAPENTSDSDTASITQEPQQPPPGRRRQSIQLGELLQPEIQHLLQKSQKPLQDIFVFDNMVKMSLHNLPTLQPGDPSISDSEGETVQAGESNFSSDGLELPRPKHIEQKQKPLEKLHKANSSQWTSSAAQNGSLESHKEVSEPGLLNSWVPSLCRAYVDQLTLQAATYTAQLTPPPPPVGLRTSRPLGMESPSLLKALKEEKYQDQSQEVHLGSLSPRDHPLVDPVWNEDAVVELPSCELTDVPDHYVECLDISLVQVSGQLYI